MSTYAMTDKEITPPPQSNAPEGGDTRIKRNNYADKSFLKPIGIVAGVILFGVVLLAFSMMLPDGTQTSTASSEKTELADIDKNVEGLDNLNPDQAAYIANRQLEEAKKQTQEGVTNAPVTQRSKINTGGVTYDVARQTDLSAVTTPMQGRPMTSQELEAATDIQGNPLYKRIKDEKNENFGWYKNVHTGVLVQPTDLPLSDNATYNYSNADFGSDSLRDANSDGSGGNGGSSNGGGNNNTAATNNQDNSNNNRNSRNSNNSGNSNNQKNANQPPPPDPAIAQNKERLANDFDAYAQATARQDTLDEQFAQNQQNYRQKLYEHRTDVANDSLNNTLSQMESLYSSKGSYAPMPYTQPRQGQGRNNANANGRAAGSMATGDAPEYFSKDGSFQEDGTTDTTDPLNAPDEVGGSVGGSAGGAGNANYGSSYGNNGSPKLPKNIIRAGTKWQVVLTKSVNTDEGLQVMGELVTGKFTGSTIYGTVVPQGRDVGINFTTITPVQRDKPAIPIDAFATTLATQRSAVSSHVNRHVLRNMGTRALTAVMRGYGEAYSDVGKQVIITESGNVIETQPEKVDKDKIRGEVIGQLGEDLTKEVERFGNRPPTYRIPAGRVLNVVLASDLDITATTNTIARDTRDTTQQN